MHDAKHQAIDKMIAEHDKLKGIRDPQWYIGRIIQDGFFEWDSVGLFIAKYSDGRMPSTHVCYVYRRIMKFAAVTYDFRSQYYPIDQKQYAYFGETRVGLQVYFNLKTGRILYELSPVIIDHIDHPAEYKGDNYGFLQILQVCTGGSYEGDPANRISEGIATLRHSTNISNRHGTLTLHEAQKRGFEIFGATS